MVDTVGKGGAGGRVVPPAGLFGKGRAFDAVGIGALTAGNVDNLKDIEKLKKQTVSKHETSVMKRKKRKEKEKKKEKKKKEEKKKEEKKKEQKKERKNPPAKTKISSVSKEKAEKDRTRTRTFTEQKRKRPIINWLRRDTQAKRAGNVAAEGEGPVYFMGAEVGKKSNREKLDRELRRARLKKFLKRTRKEDKKKSEKDKKKARSE